MQGVVMYGSVMAASTGNNFFSLLRYFLLTLCPLCLGPGVLFTDSCAHMPLVLLSG
jgi:hypothetical protein